MRSVAEDDGRAAGALLSNGTNDPILGPSLRRPIPIIVGTSDPDNLTRLADAAKSRKMMIGGL